MDWFRNTEWNAEIAGRFELRLKRARDKAQYLRIQACFLAEFEPQVALQLLDRYFELGDTFDHAQAFVDQATAYERLGRLDDAVHSYERALQREAEFPDVQTQAHLELSFLIATAPIPERFEQALSLLKRPTDPLSFPVDVFRRNAAYALILTARARKGEASWFARAALDAAAKEESGLRYHPNLGLVGDRHRNLMRALERIVQGT